MEWILVVMWAYNHGSEIHTETVDNQEQCGLLGDQLMRQARKTYRKGTGPIIRVTFSCHPKGKAAPAAAPSGAA